MINFLTQEATETITDFTAMYGKKARTDYAAAREIADFLFEFNSDATDYQGFRWLVHARKLSEEDSTRSAEEKYEVRKYFSMIKESLVSRGRWEDWIAFGLLDENGRLQSGAPWYCQ